MKKGDILFTRLIPCPGIALLSGWCAGYPGHQKEFRETAEQTRRKLGHVPPFRPRDVLNLFAPRIRWEERGPEICRGKLASLWQQAAPKKVSWKEFEAAVGSADEKSFREGLATLCDALATTTKAELALEIAWAWWNMTAGQASGESTPFEKTGGRGAGPIERRLLMRSMDAGQDKIRQTGQPPRPEEIDGWMNDPANGEGGKTPKELIIQERRQLGHLAPERVAYRLSVEKLDILSTRMNEAAGQANQATDRMRNGDFSEALVLYEKAWLALKDEPAHNYRILGNMATCHAFRGRRQEAIRCLESALKANPDYTLARGNLLRLQTMTDEQYAEFRRQGVQVMREVRNG